MTRYQRLMDRLQFALDSLEQRYPLQHCIGVWRKWHQWAQRNGL